MDKFEHKSLVTKPHDLTYSYYISPGFHENVKKGRPVVMLLHGFPDYAYMWEGAIPHLLTLGYPLLLPDLLGFGGSSKPTEASLYNYKKQANSLSQCLDNEGVPSPRSVIPIGHDWGSATAQRFYHYHRDRCVGLGVLSLAYQIPSPDPFDLKKVDEITVKRFGYPQWEYWHFFTGPDAPKILKENLDRFWEINNGNYISDQPGEEGRDIWMREIFCTPNAFREYMTKTGRYKDYTVPLKDYPNGEKLRKDFIERLSRDGLEGPVQYYHSLKDNTMLEDERELCNRPDDAGRKITVPMLYIGQTGDWVCRSDLMGDARKEGLVGDNLTEKVLESGHWTLYEKPEENARIIGEWLVSHFPVEE